MDSSDDDYGTSALTDSGFLEDLPELDQPLADPSPSIRQTQSATDSLNSPPPHSALDNGDLHGNRLRNIEGFGQKIPLVEVDWYMTNVLPKLHHRIPDIGTVVKSLDNDPEAVNLEEDGWAMFTEADMKKSGPEYRENKLFKPVPELVEKICIAAGMTSQEATLGWQARPNSSPESFSRPNSSQPDAVAVMLDEGFKAPIFTTKVKQEEKLEAKQKDADAIRWVDVAIASEFKKSENDSRDNHVKTLWSMAHILRDDPRRRFVLGLSIEGVKMRLWFCSRSDVFVTEPFDFMKKRDVTAQIFLSLTYATPVQLGYDDTMKLNKDRTLDITVRDHDGTTATYRTVRLLSNVSADAPRGRATRAWVVHKLLGTGDDQSVYMKDGKAVEYALKDCWIDDDRWLEGDILRKIREDAPPAERDRLQEYFLNPVAHGRVYAGGEVDHTRSVMLNGECLPVSEPPQYLLVPLQPNPKKREVPSEHRSQGTMAVTQTGPRPMPRYSPKIHYRIVYKEVGKTLRDVESMSEVFGHLGQVMIGLNILYSCGWIHRDISVGNILLVGQQIKITDVEYAKPLDDDQPPHGIRTGTIFFMSTEVEEHRYQHWKRPNVERRAQRDDWMELVEKRSMAKLRPLSTPTKKTNDSTQKDLAPFRHNVLHDMESAWWLALYLVLNCVLARRDKKGRLSVCEADLPYQQAQQQLASDIFMKTAQRKDIMTVDGFLGEKKNIGGLDLRVQGVLLALNDLRDIIHSAYVEAERFLHKEPHQPDFEAASLLGNEGLFATMSMSFLEIAATLDENDIFVTTDGDTIRTVYRQLEEQRAGSKRGATEQDGEGSQQKKAKLGDVFGSSPMPPVISTSSNVSGSEASASGASVPDTDSTPKANKGKGSRGQRKKRKESQRQPS